MKTLLLEIWTEAKRHYWRDMAVSAVLALAYALALVLLSGCTTCEMFPKVDANQQAWEDCRHQLVNLRIENMMATLQLRAEIAELKQAMGEGITIQMSPTAPTQPTWQTNLTMTPEASDVGMKLLREMLWNPLPVQR